MASWLERLFGSDVSVPQVGPPAWAREKYQPHISGGPFPKHPEATIGAASPPTPVPTPKGGGIGVSRPDIFKAGGLATLPESYTSMVEAGLDPAGDNEQIGPGFMMGMESDEEGDIEGLHGKAEPFTFDPFDPAESIDPDSIESPMQKMAQSSMIRDIDPEEGFVPGEDGVADAIHRAMQNFKQKQAVPPTGPFAGNPQDSVMGSSDVASNLPEGQITPDLEPLISGESGGWGDNSAPMLRGMGPVTSQAPNINKQNMFKALLSRLH